MGHASQRDTWMPAWPRLLAAVALLRDLAYAPGQAGIAGVPSRGDKATVLQIAQVQYDEGGPLARVSPIFP